MNGVRRARPYDEVGVERALIESNLSEQRPHRVSDENDRKVGVFGAGDCGELIDGINGAVDSAWTQVPELRFIAVPLFAPGLAVAAVIVGVDNKTVADELGG